MEPNALRTALHEAIDTVIDRYLAGTLPPPSDEEDDGTDGRIEVVMGEDRGPLTHTWPSGNEESFARSRSYSIRDGDRELVALVAWTDRHAWARLRQRAVVFGRSAGSLYPWTEFVETDDGRVAAGIPDPDRPRALLKDGDELPAWSATATVERTDRLFADVRRGPSLRLVLAADDEAQMVSHGYRVAGLRGRR